jgi:hypothetical protein
MTRVEEFLPVEARLTPVLGAHTTAPIVISPVFKTPEEVEAGSPLFGYLEHLRARLRELGARRIRRGDAWYWELKPDLKPSEVFTL